MATVLESTDLAGMKQVSEPLFLLAAQSQKISLRHDEEWQNMYYIQAMCEKLPDVSLH